MAKHLRQSTEVNVKIGTFVDVGDGFTPETGITLGAADEAELLKPGTTAIADISGNAWGAITSADGWYWLTLTSGNTDTVGILTVVVQDDSVCLPVYMEFEVLNANVYDSLYGAAAADYLEVDTKQIEGGDATDAINAQVVDVLSTDTHAEASGVVGATASLKDAIVWLKTLARNKITQTATTQTLRNDADDGNIATATVSDDGTTATRGEFS